MARQFNHTFIRDDSSEVVVTYTATDGDPGNTHGLPEDCWPPEAPEVEILAAEDLAGQAVTLTDAERDRMEVYIAENFYDDHDGWDDL